MGGGEGRQWKNFSFFSFVLFSVAILKNCWLTVTPSTLLLSCYFFSRRYNEFFSSPFSLLFAYLLMKSWIMQPQTKDFFKTGLGKTCYCYVHTAWLRKLLRPLHTNITHLYSECWGQTHSDIQDYQQEEIATLQTKMKIPKNKTMILTSEEHTWQFSIISFFLSLNIHLSSTF